MQPWDEAGKAPQGGASPSISRPTPEVMWHLFYNAVLILASPIILVILLAKQRCRRGLSQRFGFRFPVFRPDHRPLVWVHAVSLGEAVAVAPLVKELHRRYPDHRFVVSTVTETGREAVEERLAGVAEHIYAPLDFPWVVSRLVTKLKPVLYLFVETELWPNLLRDLHRRGVPTVMVNGRLSTRSFSRQQWGPVRLFYRAMLRRVTLCLMQSERDVERIIALGADARVVRRTGNIKFDQPIPVSTDRDAIRRGLGLHEREQILVAGSTHSGEEEALIDCYRNVVAHKPDAVLVLAPRHIERAGQVEAMVRSRGLAVQRRSILQPGPPPSAAGPRVILLDSRGELAALYSQAVVAFVGGTLVPVGGHNLLEPAVWGKPVLFGPYTDHCAEIASLLIESGGGRHVADAADLAQQVLHLFVHEEERLAMGRSARQAVEANQGALLATVEAIEQLLNPRHAGSEAACSSQQVSLMAGR